MATNLVVPAGGALLVDPRDGQLTINTIAMMCPAWRCTDLKQLWRPATVRGKDKVLPGVPAVKPYPRRPDVTKRTLPMVIVGYVNRAGTPQADPTSGLEANIYFLRANVVDPPGTGDGTYPAVLTLHNGATKTGAIHVVDMNFGNQVDAVCLATIDIEIPAGVLS